MLGRALSFIRTLLEPISRRLVNKLILIFTTVIILVVTSLTFISYRMLQDEAINHSIASTSNNLLLVNQNLEEYFEDIEQFSLPEIRFDQLSYALANEAKDYSSRMYIEEYLRDLFFARDDLESIYLYFVDQQKYYSISKENYDITVRTGTQPDILEAPWYEQLMNSPNNLFYQSFAENDHKTGYLMNTNRIFMAHHRLLRTLATRQPQVIFSFYFNSSAKDEIMKNIPYETGEHLLFLSADQELFHADDIGFYSRAKATGLMNELKQQPTKNGRLTWEDRGEQYLVVYDRGQKNGWSLIKPVPYKQLNRTAAETRNLNFFIGFLFLLLSVILISLTSNAITKPLKMLSLQMRRLSAGDFDAQTEVKGRDEIAYLSRHFNQMVRRTNELINERYKMKLVEKNAILKALEAEINPHFLYNALQAISTKALKNDRYDIADMIDALAMTLRYCISGKDVVYAKEELKHIERYLSLQKARFGSRLQVQYEWDELLMELEIPKLSIQTLVENAIKHALEKVSSTITITIGARITESHAIITVVDDGPGFTAGKLEQVISSFQNGWEHRGSDNENIGLVNLYTRLKLLYGEAAELRIQTDQSGTVMEMRLPRGDGNYV